MTTENKWTKFSERLPDNETAEVYVVRDVGQTPSVAKNPPYRTWKDWSHYYAWHPMTYPDPPREETQLDKDRDAMFKKYASKSIENGLQVARAGEVDTQYYEGWLDALAYERAEVAKELEQIMPSNSNLIFETCAKESQAWQRLRRRCGLDK